MDAVSVLTMNLAPDMEVRVRRVSTDLREDALVEVREYIPSADRWGRGIILSAEVAEKILHPDLMKRVKEVELA